MTLPYRYIGCDISKLWLDLYDPQEGRVRRIANTRKATEDFARSLAGSPAFVVFEATGPYERALRAALHEAGVACARINPAQARRYAQALGRRAKTDALDARLLADLGLRLCPQPEARPCPHRERLAALSARRDQLVAMRVMETNRLEQAGERIIRLDIRRAIARLGAAIARLEAEISASIDRHDSLRRQARLLASAPGIGAVSTHVLLALMPELGRTRPKALAAMAGLAPFNHDSGRMKGQRAIAGGRRRVRQALYIAAMRAKTVCPQLKAFAERLENSAKPKKVIIIAVARKLLTRLNAMLRDQTSYATT